LATWGIRNNVKAFEKALKSEVSRLGASQNGNSAKSNKKSRNAAKGNTEGNLLQELISTSGDARNISSQLLLAQSVSIPTTSFLATNTLLDILASPKEEQTRHTILKEVQDAVDTDEDLWTQASLQKMKHLDSALRESSRRESMTGISQPRAVIKAGGITTPEGWQIPQGSMVAVHTYAAQRDVSLYPEAEKYKPWRFTTSKSRAARNPVDELPFPSPFPTVLGEQILKLLFAYILTRYDIYMVMEGGIGGNWNGKGKRPECEWMVGGRCLPPTGAKVKVRRKLAYR
jgi:hypothetical protein